MGGELGRVGVVPGEKKRKSERNKGGMMSVRVREERNDWRARGGSVVGSFGLVSYLLQSKSQGGKGEGRHTHTSEQLTGPEMVSITAWYGSPDF